MADYNVTIKDNSTKRLAQLETFMKGSLVEVKEEIGQEEQLLFAQHLTALPPNSRGWPSTGFYKKTSVWYELTAATVLIKVDNESKPGAFRQRVYGGVIKAKNGKYLTIPARQEFANKRARDFTNLRFVSFASGAKALVIGQGGTGRLNFKTGRDQKVRGAGARSEAMVAYWLKESVSQEPDPSVVPTKEQVIDAAKRGAARAVENILQRLKTS